MAFCSAWNPLTVTEMSAVCTLLYVYLDVESHARPCLFTELHFIVALVHVMLLGCYIRFVSFQRCWELLLEVTCRVVSLC